MSNIIEFSIGLNELRILSGFKVLKSNIKGRDTLDQVEITFTPEEGAVEFVATDSYRLIRYRYENINMGAAAKPATLLVRLTNLMDVIDVITKLKQGPKVGVYYDENMESTKLVISGHGVVTPHHTFPNWKTLYGATANLDEILEEERYYEHEGMLPAFNPEYLADLLKLQGPTASIRKEFGQPFQMLQQAHRDDGLGPWHFITQGKSIIIDYFLMPVRTEKHTMYDQRKRDQARVKEMT